MVLPSPPRKVGSGQDRRARAAGRRKHTRPQGGSEREWGPGERCSHVPGKRLAFSICPRTSSLNRDSGSLSHVVEGSVLVPRGTLRS